MSESESRKSLKEWEMEYGTIRKSSASGTLRSLTPPPTPSDYSDPPPPYESLDLGHRSSLRRHSCPPNPEGIPYLGQGKEFYDAGDYHQLTACIILSCIVFWLMNPVFGIVAFIIAVLGKRRAAEEDYARANHYAKLSCYISLAGIIVASVVACILLTVFLAP